jgi:hypothetical protein
MPMTVMTSSENLTAIGAPNVGRRDKRLPESPRMNPEAQLIVDSHAKLHKYFKMARSKRVDCMK